MSFKKWAEFFFKLQLLAGEFEAISMRSVLSYAKPEDAIYYP